MSLLGRRPLRAIAIGLVLLVALVVVPLPLASYHQDLATRVLIFALFAMSLDLLYGYAGLMSLGHAAFFGVGGYTVGLLMVQRDVTSLWAGAAIALVATAVAAAIFGIVALRVRGVYFILVTFALGQMLASLGQQWHVLQAGGAEAVAGILQPEIPPFTILWDSLSFYYFALVVVVAATLGLIAIVRSRFGDALKGIRENETRMAALGYDPWRLKYAAFVISGVFAGIAGILFAYQNGLIAPTNVDVAQSGLVLLMVILGGAGSLVGAALGAVVVVLVQYWATDLVPERVNLVMGSLFVATVLVLRGGLAPTLARVARTVGGARAR
ncbi:MAG: branched-chain amino acid ABC transporter permease [Solirubrobacteraceae bacterium]|nr:branched-chain amino acid ABC transporter permease [Solirubrobacteraceae bacterium]